MIPPKVIPKLQRSIDRLRAWRYAPLAAVELEAVETTEHFRTPPRDLAYSPAPLGSKWGACWGTVWFRGKAVVPKGAKGRAVYYRMALPAEKLLFVDGRPAGGLDHMHQEVLLTANAKGGEVHALDIEMYAGHPFPGIDPHRGHVDEMMPIQFVEVRPGQWPPLPLEASGLVVERTETAGLYYDADVLLRLAQSLDEASLRRADVIEKLNQALDLVPLHWQDEAELETACRQARRSLRPLLARRNSATAPELGLVGHAHIDLVWLWPMRESIRKCARTFSTILGLMERYPEVTFLQSQPLYYEWMAEHYPELMPRIRKAVKQGNWEPNGGMWVESDTNIPSGESLIRQFVEGRKATMDLFGYCGDTLWLPDVFGYSAALPQILKECEIEFFVTAKLQGNDTNPIPHDTFTWEGIDGSGIFTHVILSPRWYNEVVTTDNMIDRWRRVRHKELTPRALVAAGHGDGGGGLTRESCEMARRLRDLEGAPKCRFVSVSAFLTQMRKESPSRPRWVGELYYERHRGTYTSQGRIKRLNRRCEILLHNVEWLHTMGLLEGLPYPAKRIQDHWRVLLTNQFHDILPGSSIRAANEEAVAELEGLEKDLDRMRAECLGTLSNGLEAGGDGDAHVIANSLAWDREEVVVFESGTATAAWDAAGNRLATQPLTRGGKRCVAVRARCAGLAFETLRLGRDKTQSAASPFKLSGQRLDTPFYRVRFDKAGKITQLHDKEAGRELVQKGRRLNDFYTAEDLPVVTDAWDIDLYYRDKMVSEDRCVAREVVADGPLLCTIRSRYDIGRRSTLVQDMTFYAHSRRIDFATEVQWEETHTLLKAGFPVDVQADQWRNEIQFGHLTRPLHSNTPFDAAKFEICAHRWVDVSEGAYGVALLNDCKYGHDGLDKMISLTLLKSAWAPDEAADNGRHVFTYALLPHLGAFSAETVVREAAALNAPLVTAPIQGNGTARGIRLCTVSNPDVVLDTVKKAEDDDAVILRLYEAGHTRARTTLAFDRPVADAWECNALEHTKKKLAPGKDGSLNLEFRPFEIKTIKVAFKAMAGRKRRQARG